MMYRFQKEKYHSPFTNGNKMNNEQNEEECNATKAEQS